MPILLIWHLCNLPNSQKVLKKETKLIQVKKKREQKHNFIDVKNEITYVESIVNKSREENLIPFVILQSMLPIWFWWFVSAAKLNFFLCIWSLRNN